MSVSGDEGPARANGLSGSEWLRNSISIWPVGRSGPDRAVGHPAVFPEALVTRLLECYLHGPDRIVLDPFMGLGTTLLSACRLGHRGVGFEIYGAFADDAEERLSDYPGRCEIFRRDARDAAGLVEPGSVDMLVTSPPYWNILKRRRTADGREARSYGDDSRDIGNTDSYDDFLKSFLEIMAGVRPVLRPGAYCVVNVMDIRVKSRLYVLHADVIRGLEAAGFGLDDIVIWDRRSDYNRLRPLGYPRRFRINRVHEYLLVFRNPDPG